MATRAVVIDADDVTGGVDPCGLGQGTSRHVDGGDLYMPASALYARASSASRELLSVSVVIFMVCSPFGVTPSSEF